MDSFTQVLLGIATAEVIAGRQLGNRTFIYGAILGTIPDLDVVVGMFMNPVSGVAIHRGLSHSLLFFGILSPIIGWLIAKKERDKLSFEQASILVFFCLFTHVVLDSFTSWGTQILWPSSERFAFKTIFVIDPLYTIPLLISLIYVFKSKTHLIRKKYIFRGLIVSSCYLILTCGIKIFALHKFQSALELQNISYEEIIVKPTAFNTILWNANVKTSDGYLIGDYSLFDSKSINFTLYTNDQTSEEQIINSVYFRQLVCVSESWYIITKQNGKIYFNDLRFGLLNDDSTDPQFAFSYEFEQNNNGEFIVTEVPKAKKDGKLLLQKLWKRLKGN